MFNNIKYFVYVFNKRQESEGVKMVNLKFNMKDVQKNTNSGITLISLVVTIIVLLILARHQYFDAVWRKWIT